MKEEEKKKETVRILDVLFFMKNPKY